MITKPSTSQQNCLKKKGGGGGGKNTLFMKEKHVGGYIKKFMNYTYIFHDIPKVCNFFGTRFWVSWGSQELLGLWPQDSYGKGVHLTTSCISCSHISSSTQLLRSEVPLAPFHTHIYITSCRGKEEGCVTSSLAYATVTHHLVSRLSHGRTSVGWVGLFMGSN
jgi:hypothetical protein